MYYLANYALFYKSDLCLNEPGRYFFVCVLNTNYVTTLYTTCSSLKKYWSSYVGNGRGYLSRSRISQNVHMVWESKKL